MLNPIHDRRSNHGAVMFHREGEHDSRVWQLARSQGQDVVLYAKRRLEQADDGRASRLWASASTVPYGEPSSLFHTGCLGERTEYVRYEPASERRFQEMGSVCSGYRGSPSVAVPWTARDEEAMELLTEMQSREEKAMSCLDEDFHVSRRHNLRRSGPSGLRLSQILKSIPLQDSWAFFLGFFGARDGVVVFLSGEESDVEGLFPLSEGALPPKRRADWLHDYGVIEKW